VSLAGGAVAAKTSGTSSHSLFAVSYRRSADFEVPGGATSMYTLEVWAFEPGTGQTTSGSSRAVMLDSQKICRANYKMRKVQKAKLFLADELGSTSSIPPPSLGAGAHVPLKGTELI
jgi:hypothetical protein